MQRTLKVHRTVMEELNNGRLPTLPTAPTTTTGPVFGKQVASFSIDKNGRRRDDQVQRTLKVHRTIVEELNNDYAKWTELYL